MSAMEKPPVAPPCDTRDHDYDYDYDCDYEAATNMENYVVQ
jgi:hypothetical protein